MMDLDPHDRNQPAPWWRSPIRIICLGFVMVAAFFLLTEHTAHVFGVLPWLLLLACPLMHLFMHHGHHGGNDHKHPDTAGEQEERATR